MSSSQKFRALQSPQNNVIHVNGLTEIYVLNVGVARLNPQILMAYPQSIVLYTQFLIRNASFSILLPQISLIQCPSSVKRKRCLTQKVLKIEGFPTKCLQALLALLAAFSRFGLGI